MARRENEGELATTSLEFEYLRRKSQCEILIGGDDISNDVITLGTCFSMFVYIRAEIWQLSRRVATGNWRWNSNSRDVVAISPSFSRPAVRERPEELARRLPIMSHFGHEDDETSINHQRSQIARYSIWIIDYFEIPGFLLSFLLFSSNVPLAHLPSRALRDLHQTRRRLETSKARDVGKKKAGKGTSRFPRPAILCENEREVWIKGSL